MAICYLGVGSNLGYRRKNIFLAIQKISELKSTNVLKISKMIKTKPQGGPQKQPDYLNCALKIETKFSPYLLLKKLKKIEKEMGRTSTVRYGPRIIDLDILLYEDKIINKKGLKIPHPKMFFREFVLKPLSEIL
ncbi:MAG: 2-amino-4-hydroxy-6-hydroxymethyldihydropteridine diphosphokinase [Candidatus Omnitrophica bacterium]|nr:2-amino-4-hydroxy-6-hydroxymethyldihydropteridine diphosphokinase [Candidatus Omnitrophota bacterium]MCM8799516.1 2-amino-4-hydroxy-6-hydroxymethyldihydropteridine diphosphokinase [Candidatus Omnitrophota bacterium]